MGNSGESWIFLNFQCFSTLKTSKLVTHEKCPYRQGHFGRERELDRNDGSNTPMVVFS
jgi:hypothetical protein